MKWHYRMAVLVTDSTSLWNGRRFSGVTLLSVDSHSNGK
jgi:hypothetical protein